jgi:hypothetical protein
MMSTREPRAARPSGAAFQRRMLDRRANGGFGLGFGRAVLPAASEPLEVGAKRRFQILFAALSNGNPVQLVDPSTLLNTAWKWFVPAGGPACAVSLVIDDVAFYR